MAENTMKLEVITPERSFYTGDVTFVELNTTEGEVGISSCFPSKISLKEKSESTQDTFR